MIAGRAADEVDLHEDFDEVLGVTCAEGARAMRGFAHPSALRTLEWDPRRVGELADRTAILPPELASLVQPVLARTHDLAARTGGLPAGVFHADLTLSNVMTSDGRTVSGVIDFGDMHHTERVADLAISLASLLRSRRSSWAAISAFLRGYQRVQPLEEAEVAVLGDLVLARLAASVLITSSRPSPDAHHAQTALAMSHDSARVLTELLEQPAKLPIRLARATGLARGTSTTRAMPDLAERRRRVMGGALSPLFYREPLQVVRGEGAWLYDATGAAYLDAYNNVPVLGHAHPAVARSIATQQERLNVNSRYLHPNAVELAERLVASMPSGLDTCVLVNSGSEANDLAWRMASLVTGRRGAVVSDSSYHGVSTVTAAQSSNTWRNGYHPDWVATFPAPAPNPDGQGPGRRDAMERFADAAAWLGERGHEVALTLADPMFTSGGVLDPTPGFVRGLAEATHTAGGLFLADEVQAGFGRSGRGLWSFPNQDLTPDFVALGKPMGNGHPVAALLTRREIADAFTDVDEYFSTFGANPVSAAAALTVLDVIEDEQLVPRSATTGALLRARISALGADLGLELAVRGSGLIAGVEIPPSTGIAVPRLVESLRDRHVLLSNTGPLGNVLKVRPPLIWNARHIEVFIDALRHSLVAEGRRTR